MSGDRLDVSVTFDERRGYVASAPELPQPVLALSLGGLRRKIEVLMLPDEVEVRLQLDVRARRERDRRRAAPPPTRAYRRGSVATALAVLALALLHAAASARELSRSSGAMPFVNQGGCPSGYYTSSGFCAPLNRDSRPAVPKPPGASCPSGWYASGGAGGACVKLNR